MMIDHIEGRVSMQIPDFSIITINHQSLNGFVSLDIMMISIYDLIKIENCVPYKTMYHYYEE